MCLGNWLFKELLSSSRCLCLRLWIDLSQQQNHGESQGDSRFQCTSVIPAFPVPPFLSSPEVSFVYQLRKFTFMDYFFLFSWLTCFPCVLAACLEGLWTAWLWSVSASGLQAVLVLQKTIFCITFVASWFWEWGSDLFYMHLPANFCTFFFLHS